MRRPSYAHRGPHWCLLHRAFWLEEAVDILPFVSLGGDPKYVSVKTHKARPLSLRGHVHSTENYYYVLVVSIFRVIVFC